MWKAIKTIWAQAWDTAKSNWKMAWVNTKDALISFLKAIGSYLYSILYTVIAIPVWTGICKTGKLIIEYLIKLITKA